MDKEEKSSHSSIPKQIGASLVQLEEVESSMAMHKALLDLGESFPIRRDTMELQEGPPGIPSHGP